MSRDHVGAGSQQAQKVREPFYYQHRSFFVGLFLLIPLVAIPGFLIYGIVTSDFIQPWEHFSINYDNIHGLQEGADVRYHGVKVGSVQYINLSSDGDIDVFIRIKETYVPLLLQGCVAELGQRSFIVGDWEIELQKQEELAGVVKPGGQIPSRQAPALDEALQRMVRMVTVADSSLMAFQQHGIMQQLVNGDTLVDFLGQAGTSVDNILYRVHALLGNADTMVADLSRLGTHGYEAVDTLMVFARHAIVLTDQIDRLLKDVSQLSTQYKDMPEQVQKTLKQIHDDAEQMEILLKGLQRHWLFKGAVNKARQQQKQQ